MRDITLIFGCMFSGKTTKLIELFSLSAVENHEKMAVKPLLDTRYLADRINSHSGLQLPGHRISKPDELYAIVEPHHKELYIDEVQFFNDSISNILLDLSLQGIKIHAAGLNLDYLGRDFGPVPALKKLATTHVELFAKCSVCGQKANHTYRKAGIGDQILIGDGSIYEARCKTHWDEGMQLH